MPEKALAVQPAREVAPFTFEKVETVLNRMNAITDAIAHRAFELFEGNGLAFGHDLDDWLKAEAELLHPVHVSVSDSGEALQVKAEVPGFSAKELQVSVEPRRLIITGERGTREERKEAKTVYCEHCANQILRVVDLPADVDIAKVRATLKDGILEFAMPKATLAIVPIESKVG